MDFQLYEGSHKTAIACQTLQLYHSTTLPRLVLNCRNVCISTFSELSSPVEIAGEKQEIDGLRRRKA